MYFVSFISVVSPVPLDILHCPENTLSLVLFHLKMTHTVSRGCGTQASLMLYVFFPPSALSN